MEFLPYILTILSIPMFATVLNRWLERQLIEDKKQTALKAIVHEDIVTNSNKVKRNMRERVLDHYEDDEVTPELIEYFKENYLSVLEEETRKIAEQKALEKEKQIELNHEFQDLEKNTEVQFNAFKSVKELGHNSNKSLNNYMST